MFDFLKKASGTLNETVSKDDIAALLRTDKNALKAFEEAYAASALQTDTLPENFFEINAKQMADMAEGIELEGCDIDLDDMISRIVNELLNQTFIYEFDGKTSHRTKYIGTQVANPVTNEEIMSLPENLRPQLTGNLMKVDISQPSYAVLLDSYMRYVNEKNPKTKQGFYHRFRQGLDILDLDPITYKIIGTNPNSMGHWLPQMANAIEHQDFFKIPKTTIIKVPMPLLQLTRLEYTSLTRTTLDIVDKFCRKAFSLDETKDYFIKTGTYSSKFDFRNAHVHEAKEVRELGEYLLFIHHQACQMAAPLNNRCIYGVSTTNEWVVREFIKDKESNPCIYKGLPLHTEYRVFVDFDTKEVIGFNPYWDPDVMKQRFGHEDDADSPHNIHDYVIYKAHEDTLMRRYHANIKTVLENLKTLLQNVNGLTGQWSIDIMQNDDEFWLIDMALAETSAFYNCVPRQLRNPTKENWIPKMSHSVQMVNDNYDVIHNPNVKAKYPILYAEIIEHDKSSTSSWYDLSDEAYAEYLCYIDDETI